MQGFVGCFQTRVALPNFKIIISTTYRIPTHIYNVLLPPRESLFLLHHLT